MAHDRFKHVSSLRSGSGRVIVANDTLGPINLKTAWLVEHFEMAISAYTGQPEAQWEINHPIPKLPWKNAAGLPLNTLRIELARVRDIASALPGEWFQDCPVSPDDIFVVSMHLIRR